MQKVGTGDTFKPPIGNESVHEINNDNGVRIVNFATLSICQENNIPTLQCS
jgi:hypothetical protein